MGDRFVSSEKILVIDFTLEDTAGADHARNRAEVKTQTRERNGQQKEVEKKVNLEAAEPAAEIVPHAVPPVTISSRESPMIEIQMPVQLTVKQQQLQPQMNRIVPAAVSLV